MKPQLPPYDLKLYETETVKEEKEPEIVALAKTYFSDKAIIKE